MMVVLHVRWVLCFLLLIGWRGYAAEEERTMTIKKGILGGVVEVQYRSLKDIDELAKLKDRAVQFFTRRITEGNASDLEVIIGRNVKLSASCRFVVVEVRHAGEGGAIGLLYDDIRGEYDTAIQMGNSLLNFLSLTGDGNVVDRSGKKDVGEKDLRLGVNYVDKHRFDLAFGFGGDGPVLVVRQVGSGMVSSEGVPAEILQQLMKKFPDRDVSVKYWYRLPGIDIFTLGNGDYGVIRNGNAIDVDGQSDQALFGVGELGELLQYRK